MTDNRSVVYSAAAFTWQWSAQCGASISPGGYVFCARGDSVKKKNPHAVAMGRKGGKAWAESRSKDELSASGQKASRARWDRMQSAEKRSAPLDTEKRSA